MSVRYATYMLVLAAGLLAHAPQLRLGGLRRMAPRAAPCRTPQYLKCLIFSPRSSICVIASIPI